MPVFDADKLWDENLIKVIRIVLQDMKIVTKFDTVLPQHTLQSDFGMDCADVGNFSFRLGQKLGLIESQREVFYSLVDDLTVHTVMDIVRAVKMSIVPQEERVADVNNLDNVSHDIIQRKSNVIYCDYDVFLGPPPANNDVRINKQRIGVDTAKIIVHKLQTTPLPPDFCWRRIGVSFDLNFLLGNFMVRPGAGRLNLCVGGRPVGKCGNMPPKNAWEFDNSVRASCVYNLTTGKCQDEFMRQTVGAVLFPQFYANNKQK